jgi:hypothetical protein
MTASERVTWDVCPSGGRFPAFGWCDGVLVEVDCPSGCRLTPRTSVDEPRPCAAFRLLPGADCP